MSSLASGKMRSNAVASTCEHEWRSSSSGVMDMAERKGFRIRDSESSRKRIISPGHSERGEESNVAPFAISNGILRFAQNDKAGSRFFQRFELVAVLAIEHRPAGGGQFLAQGVCCGEIFYLLRRPALFGKR